MGVPSFLQPYPALDTHTLMDYLLFLYYHKSGRFIDLLLRCTLLSLSNSVLSSPALCGMT